MSASRCWKCAGIVDDAARSQGRCPHCDAPIARRRTTATGRAEADEEDTDATSGAVIGDGAADPGAETVTDLSHDDILAALAARAERQARGAETLALTGDAESSAQTLALPDGVDASAQTLALIGDEPRGPAPGSSARTLALPGGDPPAPGPSVPAQAGPSAQTLALPGGEGPIPSHAGSEHATRHDPPPSEGAGRGDAQTASGPAQAAATETREPKAPASPGTLRRYTDGGLVTVNGERVADTATDAAVFPLPHAESDVKLRIGPYDVLGELGRGGMGVVYRAYSLRLGRLVALKMLTAGTHASEAQVVRFQNEAMLAARLTHPNVVPVFDAGEHEGNLYFVMAYVEGAGFGDLIERDAVEDGLRVLARTARAIDYAHRRGIVHRDIKPDNILVDQDGEPQITDFGIAKNIELEIGITKTGATLGTPAYMAPEQANRVLDRVGPLTDVYALGATMYHLLTGKPPFSGPTPIATLLAVLEKDPEPPRAATRKNRKRDLDPDLETICLKAMEKAASARYPSAKAFAEDLEAALEGRPISARPIGAAERLQKLVQRNRAAFVGLLLVFTTLSLMTVAFGAVLAFNISRTSDSLRDLDRQAGVDQATTLERAIVTNMRQGRADVVRELVDDLRGQPRLSRIEVVRPDKSLAYTDRATRDAVAQRLESPRIQSWIQDEHAAFVPRVQMLQTVAFGAIDDADPAAEAPRFDFPDDAWREVLAGDPDDVVTRMDRIDGVPHLTILRPIPNGAACQICHGAAGEPEARPAHERGDYGGGYGYDAPAYGDDAEAAWDPHNKVRAVLVVHRSQAQVEAQIKRNTETTILVGGATAGVFIALLLLFARIFGFRLRPRRFGAAS